MPEHYANEEEVKIKFLLPFLKNHGYSDDCFEFNKAIQVQEGRRTKTIFADVIVYSAANKLSPLLLIETKAPTEILDRKGREQAISYARLLPKIAPITVLTNGQQTQVFQTLSKARIPALPKRDQLQNDIVNFIVSKETQESLRAEARHELFIIDDVASFKNILKSCHNEIRNNEGVDPTVAFDEMSKVLFCKLYEEKHNSQNNRFRLPIFDDTLTRLHVNVARQIFDETKKNPAYSGLFVADAKINLQDRTIRKIIGLFEDYDLSLTAFDVKGEAFEYFLGDTFTGGLGEYFTPRNVVEFIVDALEPRIGERTIDPFCGTGGFLIYAFEVVGEKIRLQDFSDEEKARWRHELSNRCLYGTDWKERTSQACKMNMMVHGDGSAGVFMHDGLSDVDGAFKEGEFDICCTNPPFGSFETNSEVLAKFELGAGRKSQDRVILAIERAIRLTKPGGRIGIVVIDGLLNNASTKYVRDYIRETTSVKAIVSLPSETFEGYGARAKTSVLFLEKKSSRDSTGKQDKVLTAVVSNAGYAPNGNAIPGNELPDVLIDLRGFLTGKAVPSQHNAAWVVDLGDRMDAEFYAPASHIDGKDVSTMLGDIGTALSEIQSEYASIQNEIHILMKSQTMAEKKFSDLIEVVRHKEPIKKEETYRLLGVRWWGEGAFIREEKTGREIKASSVNRVSAGCIIYNRLFAFRGSFAVLQPEHHDCHVSNEFPTFRVRSGITLPEVTAEYLVHCLNSPQYLEKVNKLSTGSTKTSRNRFKEDALLEMNVSIPTDGEVLQKIVTLLNRVATLRPKQKAMMKQIDDLNKGVASFLPGPDVVAGTAKTQAKFEAAIDRALKKGKPPKRS